MPDTPLKNEADLPLPTKRTWPFGWIILVLLVAFCSYLLYATLTRPAQPTGWHVAKMSFIPDPLNDFIKIQEDWGAIFMILSPGYRTPSRATQVLTLDETDWIRSNRKLKELALERIDLGQANLDWLSTLPRLEEFTFEGIGLNDEHLMGIGGAASLRIIDLSVADENKGRDVAEASGQAGASISQQGIKHLASLPNLKNIYIEQLPLGDGAFVDLAGMANLTSLKLQGCALSGVLLKSITPANSFSSLNLSNNPIEDDSLEHITHLKKLNLLQLNDTPITDLALKHIGQLSNLSLLYLEHTHITDSGLAHLAQLKNLRRLHLSDTLITDTGLGHIAQLTKLEELHLHNTKITGPGLLTLSKLPKLRTISLSVEFGNKYPKAVIKFKKTHYVNFY